MASQGPRYPGENFDRSNAGTGETQAWFFPGGVELGADDGTEVSITTSAFDTPDISRVLIGRTFGFSIPVTATINGIIVEINRRKSVGNASDFRVQLARGANNQTWVGDNKADTSLDWPSTLTRKTYGSSTDLWGTTWTPAQINNDTFPTEFGVGLSVQADSIDPDIFVDSLRVTVHYTPNHFGAAAQSFLFGASTNGIATPVFGLFPLSEGGLDLTPESESGLVLTVLPEEQLF